MKVTQEIRDGFCSICCANEYLELPSFATIDREKVKELFDENIKQVFIENEKIQRITCHGDTIPVTFYVSKEMARVESADDLEEYVEEAPEETLFLTLQKGGIEFARQEMADGSLAFGVFVLFYEKYSGITVEVCLEKSLS